MKPKCPQLSARWSRREKDILFDWDDGIGKPDGHLLYYYLCCLTSPDGKTLVGELKARGYDITTLRFSVRKPPQEHE